MKRPAIQWESCIAALETFLQQYANPPVRALLTTFDFDADMFQRIWMRVFRRYHAQVAVMADANALRRIPLLPGSLEGFQLIPVAVNGGVFHPKVALVRTHRETFAALGSGNLTQGGMGGNLELQLTGNTSNRKDQELVYGVAAFLRQLGASKEVVRMPPTGTRFCKEIIDGLPDSSQMVMSSLHKPLWSQFVERIGVKEPDSVTILSPWHAGTGEGPGTEPRILAEINQYCGRNITVLTDGDGRNAPKLPVKTVRIYKRPEMAERDDENGPLLPASLHAKSIIVRHGKKGWWFLGSANATQPALLRAAGNKGNVEVMAALPLDHGLAQCLDNEWNELFREAKQITMKPSCIAHDCGGIVLGGELIHRGNGQVLRLIAKTTKPAKVILIPQKNASEAAGVTASFNKDGIAEINKDLQNLLPDLPDRREGSKSMIIYEYYPGGAWPVVVTVPLLLNGEQKIAPTVLLTDLLRAFRGRWPVGRPKVVPSSEDDDENDDRNNDAEDMSVDRELDALTHTDHLGRLDSLGRLAAMLIKATPDNDVRRRLCDMITALAIPEHYKKAILETILKAAK